MIGILVVEDDKTASTALTEALRSRGWHVSVTDNGPTAVELAMTGNYRLVVLNLEMNADDGMGVLRAVLSARPFQKVIVLCARGRSDRGILALEQGASDYLARPFAMSELLARVLVRLQEGPPGDVSRYLHRAGVTIDLARRTATTGTKESRLSQREFELLAYLMNDPGRVIGRDELRAAVWGNQADPASNVVDVCVRRLRQKLGSHLIETVRNGGYILGTA